MALNYKIENVLKDFYDSGGRTKFQQSLSKILGFAKKDERFKTINHLAYLLATAKEESDYSLERWEADYVCGDAGVKYVDKPCQSAINYYCSTQGGKQNYCLGQQMDKRGLPYFGRGIIQLTWYDNYKKYGDLIGINLVDNPEKAFIPENSYNIAVTYMNLKRGDSNKSTFDWVDEGNLTGARKSVNGGTKKLDEVNKEYQRWVEILKKNANVVEGRSNVKKVIGVTIAVATIGVTMTLLYFALKKANKLPNFMKKIKL